jgi:hypothetical protein
MGSKIMSQNGNIKDFPSIKEIIDTWAKTEFPPLGNSTVNEISYTQNGIHAIIHSSEKEKEYHLALVFSESTGKIMHVCDCFTQEEKEGLNIMIEIVFLSFSPVSSLN